MNVGSWYVDVDVRPTLVKKKVCFGLRSRPSGGKTFSVHSFKNQKIKSNEMELLFKVIIQKNDRF